MQAKIFCKSIGLLAIIITIESTAQPKINSFSPENGPAGTSVIISGTGFNTTPGNNIVFFGAVKASVSAANTTSLTVTVPPGATYHSISVLDIVTHLTGYSSKPFITTFNYSGTGLPSNFYFQRVDFTTGSLPRNVVIADIDGDGKSELIIANGSAGTISVLRNTSSSGNIGTSSFAAKLDFAVGTFTEIVKAGDLNGDGKPDLAMIYNGRIAVKVNTATTGVIDAGSFAALVDLTPLFGGTAAIEIADMDGDGRPELIGANAVNTISVLRNTSSAGAMSFASKVDYAHSGTPSWIAIGDVDGDGKRDIIVTNAALGVNSVSVYRNTSTPGVIDATSFAARVNFTVGAMPRSVALGDIDKDGKADMVVANSDALSTTMSVLRNTATPGAIDASSFAAKVDFTTGLGPRSVALDDVNGDGKLDVVVSNFNANSISVFNNTATSGSINSSSLDPKIDFTTGNAPVSTVIGDLNGDGVAETIITTGSNDNKASVFQMDLSMLPVSISEMKARYKDRGILIEWTTQQESGIDRYEIEKSADGQQFKKVGIVPSKSAGNIPINYQWFDPDPFTGANFYRLIIIEPNQISYSTVIKVNAESAKEYIFNLFPNPINSNTILMQIDIPKGRYRIVLNNKLGQPVLHYIFDHTGGAAYKKLEISAVLQPGFYHLNLRGDKVNISKQLIKQ